MKVYELSINASYAECELLYTAGKNTVVVQTTTGISVQLPTSNLRKFIGPEGIKGLFRLNVNDQNKIQSLERIK